MLLLRNADCKINGESFFGIVVNYNEKLDVISIITECGVPDLIIHIDDVEFGTVENDKEIHYIKNGMIKSYWFLSHYLNHMI